MNAVGIHAVGAEWVTAWVTSCSGYGMGNGLGYFMQWVRNGSRLGYQGWCAGSYSNWVDNPYSSNFSQSLLFCYSLVLIWKKYLNITSFEKLKIVSFIARFSSLHASKVLFQNQNYY